MPFVPDKPTTFVPDAPEESLLDKAGSYARAGLSGLNRGLFALPHRAGLTRALGKAMFPDLSPEEAEAKVEFRHLASERKNPITASMGGAVGVTPYMMAVPGAGGLLATAGTQGAVASNLLSESNTLGGSLWDTVKGAAGGLVAQGLPMAMGKAESTFERAAARHALKGTGASPSEIAMLRDKVGTEYGDVGLEAGRAARNLRTPEGNQVLGPLTNPPAKLENIGKVATHYGPQVDEIVAQADRARPGAVDMDAVLGRFHKEAAALDTGPERAFAGGRNAEKAADLLAAFRSEVKGYKPTSTNVELGAPPQGRLGLPTNELVAGPEATFPAPRQIGTEVAYQGGLPLTHTSLQAGPEVVTSRARVQPGSQLDMMHQRDPRVPARSLLPDEPVGQTVGVQRDMFGTPSGAAVPNGPLMTQDPGVAQSVAGQGRMNAPSFPERAPPAPTSTNVVPKQMDVAEAIAFKRWLQDDVYTTSRQMNPERPAEAISKSPELRFKQKLASIFRDESEKAVGVALPDKAQAFADANRNYNEAMTWKYILENQANKHAAKGSSLDLSNYATRHLLFPMVAGGAATGNTGVGLALAGATLAGEVGSHAAGVYGHPLASALYGGLEKQAGRAATMTPNQAQTVTQMLAAMLASKKKESNDAP
jgi:hypothetical protein